MSGLSTSSSLEGSSQRSAQKSARSGYRANKKPIVGSLSKLPRGTFWDSNVLLEGEAETHLGRYQGVAQLPFSRLLLPLQTRSTIYEKRQCAYSFATYASDESPVEGSWLEIIKMEGENGFKAIITLITDADPVCQRFGSLAIQLLAIREEALPHLSEVKALKEVLPRALVLDKKNKSWDPEAQRYCISASENMTRDPSKHRFVMGFLNEIIYMMERPPHPSYRACAVGIVRNLALTPYLRAHLLPAARLSVAIMLEASQPIESRTKAADFLALISEDDHCKDFLMRRQIFSVTSKLVEQSQGGQEQRMLGNVARMMQNFVLIVESHPYLLQEETLMTIMVLGSMNGVVDCMISIARVLEILSTYSNKLKAIVSLKGIEIVLQAFFSCDIIECREAALGITIITTSI